MRVHNHCNPNITRAAFKRWKTVALSRSLCLSSFLTVARLSSDKFETKSLELRLLHNSSSKFLKENRKYCCFVKTLLYEWTEKARF